MQRNPLRPLRRARASVTAIALLTVMSVLSAAFAAGAYAQLNWDNGSGVTALNGAPTLVDISGVTKTPDGKLWAIDNSKRIIGSWAPSINGWDLENTWNIADLGDGAVTYDTEGITWVRGNEFVVVDEVIRNLIFLTITDNGVEAGLRYYLKDAPAVPGDGIEAVAYSHDESTATHDVFYVGDEVTATLMRVVIPIGGNTQSVTTTSTVLPIPEIAGLADDPNSDKIYVISESNKTVYQTTTSGATPVALFTVPMTQPEGIFYDATSQTIHVTGEGAQEHATWIGNNDEVDDDDADDDQAAQHSASLIVTSSNGDVEEAAGGLMNLASSDLDLGWDDGGFQEVGIRFDEIPVPAGATIVSATLELTADEVSYGNVSLVTRAHYAGSSAPFSALPGNVTQRPTTNASMAWSPQPWNAIGQREISPDLSAVVQEVIDKQGWSEGNPLALVITGTGDGTRTAMSFDGDPTNAPELHLTWDFDGIDEPDTTTTPDIVTPTPDPSELQSIMIQVSASSDDAEEAWNGAVNLGSSDLDLGMDNGSFQVVGMRFADLPIPAGATINSASLQFHSDEISNAGGVSVITRAHDTGSAPPFSATTHDISGRPTTAASMSWTPSAWSAIGEGHFTSSLPHVIQEVVDRDDWSTGNAIALVVTTTSVGNGARAAESFDGDPATAPRLYLSWFADGSPPDTVITPTPTPTTTPTVTVTTTPNPAGSTTSQIAASDDDVEGRTDGTTNLGSGDLDVLAPNRPVGLRFEVCVPVGANITDARLLLTADEADTLATSANVWAEDSANASRFVLDNLVDRVRTTAQVAWPAFSAWQIGDVETSPNLAPLLAEVTGRADWTGCGFVVLIIEGSGDREAVSFDNNPAAAPKLTVAWN